MSFLEKDVAGLLSVVFDAPDNELPVGVNTGGDVTWLTPEQVKVLIQALKSGLSLYHTTLDADWHTFDED